MKWLDYLNIGMGNSNKKPEDFDVVKSFRSDAWLNKEHRNGYEIWEKTDSSMRADAYPVRDNITSKDLENYEMRKNNSANIVKVHHVGFRKDSTLCSKSSDAVVLTERIPQRLSNTYNLTEPEALCILRSAYNGFNTMESFYGPIEPYEDMICFNEEGVPKVWLNSNLAVNHPESNRKVGESRSPI